MVPDTLNDWTYQAVETLCVAGQSESDRHDFKYNLSQSPNPNLTKLCCAFANTFGGFIVFGVRDENLKFEIVGLDPNKELYGDFLARIKADPDIAVSRPKTIEIPSSTKLLYVFEIVQSARRPHLPSVAGERVFWKRQGSSCVQMTLEEIRYQMNNYEEKREKLALLLIELHNIVQSLDNQASMPDGNYNGDVFLFEIIDRIVVETFTFLKADMSIIAKIDAIKRILMLLNTEKRKLLSMLAMSYTNEDKTSMINNYRNLVRANSPPAVSLTEEVERSISKKFGIENPFLKSK